MYSHLTWLQENKIKRFGNPFINGAGGLFSQKLQAGRNEK